MNNSVLQKEAVREKYTQIASQSKEQNASSCCGATGCCDDSVISIMADSYNTIDGYQPDADLGLGCGIPTEFANIRLGDTVVDLGSGAGNDAFIARKLTGPRGKVVGIDFTDAMIERAKENTTKLGLNNVEFRKGDIEDIPLTSNFANVVVSNCVLNLVPNKHKVFSEVFRILKPGGHFHPDGKRWQNSMPVVYREPFKKQITYPLFPKQDLPGWYFRKKSPSIFLLRFLLRISRKKRWLHSSKAMSK
jgi:arsenite methyltransferase